MSAETNPKVSIITVVRNGANTIVRAMDSVLSQTYPNIEYIVIDGASSDGTVDLIRQYRDRLAYWCSEPDSGIVSAFNKGIRQATGEWVGILNADDWYEADAVERIVEAGRFGDVVHGRMQFWDGVKAREIVHPNQRHIDREMTINHPTVFVRRSAYETYGLFKDNYRIAMDYELMLRLHRAGCAFVQLDAILANMSFGGVSDVHWRKASSESRVAQIENGTPSLIANLMHIRRVIRGAGRRLLQRVGMTGVVTLYRKRFAVVRKDDPD